MSKETKETTTSEKQVTRRSMLKWTGALAAAAVVGAGVGYGASAALLKAPAPVTTTTTVTTTGPPTPPPSFKPPLSPEVKQKVDKVVKDLIDKHTGETEAYHLSPYDGVVKFRVKNGVITAIEGDELINENIGMEDKYIPESAIPNGLIQWRALQRDRGFRGYIYHPLRLLYPMKRISDKRGMHARFTRISWDEALDTIATKMNQIKDKYGKYSMYNNPLAPWYECGVSGWGCISNEGNSQAARWMLGSGWQTGCGAFFTAADDITNVFHSKLIVGWGWNPTVSAGSGMGAAGQGYVLRLAHEKGIPLILIDPRYTESCEVVADQWIPIRPGTDMSMMLAVANVLFKEDLYDKAFVEKFVEVTGFAKWRDYVLGKMPGPDGAIDRTPEWAEEICGVPAETIREFAGLYAKSKPVYLVHSFAASGRQPLGDLQSRAAMILQAMTGNIGILGGHCGGCGSYGGHYPGMIQSGGPLVGETPMISAKERGYASVVQLPYLPGVNIGTQAPTFGQPIAPAGSEALTERP